VECLNPHFGFIGYFTHYQICNPNHDHDLKYWKIYIFFKVNQIIMPTSHWHHNKGGIGHSITLVIKSAACTVCTVAKFVLEVCVSVNLAYAKQIQHKAAHLCTVVFKQMSKIWYKNICTFLRYRNFRVGTFLRFTLYTCNTIRYSTMQYDQSFLEHNSW